MEENKENMQMEEEAREKKSGRIKRNITMAVVVLCICAAVYLNWSYNNQNGADSVLSDASIVEDKNAEEALAGSAGGDYVSEYFAQARLTRQESRDAALNLLQTAASSTDASQETIDSAINAISAMATYSMQETQIENMLLAKDFADCVVLMSADSIIVAVPAPQEGLTAEQVAQITDAIVSETSYSATQLRIIEVKKPVESAPPDNDADSAGEGNSAGDNAGEGSSAETPLGDGSEAGIQSLDEDIASRGGYYEEGNLIFE